MKVLISDNLSPTGVEILQKEEGIECDLKVGMSKEDLIAVIPAYHGLLVRSATKVTADVIEAATNLKVERELVRYSLGTNIHGTTTEIGWKIRGPGFLHSQRTYDRCGEYIERDNVARQVG